MKKVRILFSVFLATALLAIVSFAVSADVSLDGVQIRINEPYGVRYIANVDGAISDYDEVGMLIIPSDKLSGKLTLDTAGVGKISSINEDFRYFSVSDTSFKYTLCLVGLENAHYGNEYVVRPYVVYTEGGEQQTLYAESYENYTMTPAKITEKVLEMYADKYTDAIAADYELIDDRLTEYNLYLDELASSEDVPVEPEEPEETVIVEYLDLNENYWRLGTLGSTNGAANPGNAARIFTPAYIPADGTIITFDKASGVNYIVMEYDSDKKWISGSDWITTETYTKKNENAAYYRCVLTDYTTLTNADIPVMSEHLTIQVPVVSSRAPVALNFEKGTIAGATGIANTTSNTRVYTPEYYPVEGLVLNRVASDYVSNITVIGYDENKELIQSYGDKSANPLNVEEIASGATYVRFVLKMQNGNTVTDNDQAKEIATCVSATYTKDVNHTFFELGNINASGVGDGDSTAKFAASSEYIYMMSYMPSNVAFEFDTTYGGTYVVSYYDSSYAFISATESINSEESPAVPANTAYYRIAYCPGYTVTDDSCDYAASAFSFCNKYSLTVSDWDVGTISGTTGKESTTRADRIYTPGYYPAGGMTVSYIKNSYSTAYVLLAYDADKNFLGTSNDEIGATYDVTSEYPDAAYFRFAIKCSQDMTEDTISTVSDNITVNVTEPLFVRKELEVNAEPEETLPTFGDEGLLFRFPMTSISTYSPGNYQSGMCEVEDELWLFSTSDKGSAGDGMGVIMRYKPDWENGTAEFLGAVEHNFGHANSVDYSPENKCFVVGNGSGSFSNTANYFYVYYNAYELVKNGVTGLYIEDENCITYDWADTGISGRTKVNTCWYGKNSILVGCNNNGYVYKIALGTDDRALSLGEVRETNVGSYNGTWQVIKAYEQTDNGSIDQAPSYTGQDYDQCNQGTDYADGTLYLTCGHDGIYFWRCRLDSDGSIKRDEFHKYMVIGTTTSTSGISGIICHGDYLIFTSGGYVYVYLNSALVGE